MNTISHPRLFRKTRSHAKGFALIECTLALSILTVTGMILLQLCLNILQPRQSVLQSTLADAYMTYERAFAERIPFDSLVHQDSPWPTFPDTSTVQVIIGKLPGGGEVTGSVTRTRLPDDNNLPSDGGSGTEATNPCHLKVWKVQSVLTYQVNNRNYAKSRTIIRTQ